MGYTQGYSRSCNFNQKHAKRQSYIELPLCKEKNGMYAKNLTLSRLYAKNLTLSRLLVIVSNQVIDSTSGTIEKHAQIADRAFRSHHASCSM